MQNSTFSGNSIFQVSNGGSGNTGSGNSASANCAAQGVANSCMLSAGGSAILLLANSNSVQNFQNVTFTSNVVAYVGNGGNSNTVDGLSSSSGNGGGLAVYCTGTTCNQTISACLFDGNLGFLFVFCL